MTDSGGPPHLGRADRFWVEGVDMTRSTDKATPFTVRVTMFGTTIGAPGWSGSYTLAVCRKRQTTARGVSPEHWNKTTRMPNAGKAEERHWDDIEEDEELEVWSLTL